MATMNYDHVQEYLTTLVPSRPAEMQAMEAYAEQTDFPIIGAAAGYACYQVARVSKAKSVFELGSGYGYSTAWFAKAVQENGGTVVHHVVWDEKLSALARTYLSKLGYGALVQYHVAEAVAELNKTPGMFDLIFNDIDKDAYPEALPLIKEKLNPGGVLIVDNLLWHGQILDANDKAKTTQAIHKFTKMITSDPDFIVTILPIRDGVLVAYKP